MLILHAHPAQAKDDTFLNYLLPAIFGEPDDGPKPEQTLQAPFGKDEPGSAKTGSGQGTALMGIYDQSPGVKKADSIAAPHRSPDQVAEWATAVITQALSIDPTTYQPAIFSSNFMPYALQEYNTYLVSSQTLDTLKTKRMRLTAFTEGKPSLVQEGQLEGVYRWVFRVPVMLTFYDKAATSLKGKDKNVEPSRTQHILVNIQIARAPLNQVAEGMLIERWSVAAQN